MSDFKRGTIVDLQEVGLSYRDLPDSTGHAATTKMRVELGCTMLCDYSTEWSPSCSNGRDGSYTLVHSVEI